MTTSLSRRAALGLGLAAAAATPTFARQTLAVLRPGMTVLFQGDSITEGGRWMNSTDLNHVMGQDYGYIVAAEVGERFPERGITFLNRGISGNKVTDLAARWQADVLDLKPDLLSVMVGVNDALIAPVAPVESYENIYDELLVRTRAALPGVKIILGESFLLPVGGQKADFAAHFEAVRQRQQAVARLAGRHRAPLIRYQSAFDAACRRAPAEHWCWDGVHPTYAGHGLMAKTWLAAVEAAWPNG